MKLVSWNVCHGGGSGERSRRVVGTLLGFRADILIIPEFRTGASGDAIVAALASEAYHVTHPPAAPGKNTVLIASKSLIVQSEALDLTLPDLRHLWLVRTQDLNLVGVYMPVGAPKIPFWESVIKSAVGPRPPGLYIGDFNTGTNGLDKDPKGSPYVAPEFMHHIAAAGFEDIWRKRHPNDREYTWFSQRGKNGFRLDHAFASAEVDGRVVACGYDHAPRLSGASDHSALVVDLAEDCSDAGATVKSIAAGCIYAFADPGCPDFLKIGKDSKWPLRLRQALSHTPRGILEIGRWPVRGDLAALAQAERQALALFPREPSCPGREWVRAAPGAATERLSSLLGLPVPPTSPDQLKVFDDWRDFERPSSSKVPRRMWIGVENTTGRIKIVHSPHVDRFTTFNPTYNPHGIRWVERWAPATGVWSATKTLHPADRVIVNLWLFIVETHGYGVNDGRVGWLREDASLAIIRGILSKGGLAQDAESPA